jgi:hypothetical protein
VGVGLRQLFIRPRRMISTLKSLRCGGEVLPTTNLSAPSFLAPNPSRLPVRVPFPRKPFLPGRSLGSVLLATSQASIQVVGADR